MENNREFFDELRNLDKAAKVRICLFALMMVWCSYLAAGYAYNVSCSPPFLGTFIDIGSTGEVYIDGSDFTWLAFLLGGAANALLSFIMVFVIAVYAVLTGILSLVPVLLMRFVGLKVQYVTTRSEYRLTLAIYFIGIAVSLTVGLIITRLTAVLPLILYTAVWSLITLIYILNLRKRAAAEAGMEPKEQKQ